MIPKLGPDEYVKRMLSIPRPGGENILAFYEHRLGAICTDPRLMLLPLDDHLAHRGDGVFETLKYLDRRIYQLDAHLTRMKVSADAIFLNPPCSWEEMRGLILEVAKASGQDMGLLRILMGRGLGGFGIDPAECPVASLYIVAYGFHPKPDDFFERGVSAFRTSIPAKQGYMAKIKSVNYLPNVLMKRETVQKGFDFSFCFDEDGFLAEGATENVCLLDQSGTLLIPEFTNALAGTTLMRVLDLIQGEIPVMFRGIKEGEIHEAREVLIIGTTWDCVNVVRYNKKPIHDVRPGPCGTRIRELLRRDLRENGVLF